MVEFKENVGLLTQRQRLGLLYQNIKDFQENLTFISLDYWFLVIHLIIPGEAAQDQARRDRTAPPEQQLPPGALRWPLPWLQGWHQMPPAALPGCGGWATSATSSPGNYVASTHLFLSVKCSLNPSSKPRLHGRRLKYALC